VKTATNETDSVSADDLIKRVTLLVDVAYLLFQLKQQLESISNQLKEEQSNRELLQKEVSELKTQKSQLEAERDQRAEEVSKEKNKDPSF